MVRNKAETCSTNSSFIIKIWVVKHELYIIFPFVYIHNGIHKPKLKWKLFKKGNHG